MSCFQKAFNWLFYKKGTDPLPMAIIFLLSVQYFLESATTASVFSYLPHLVKSFGTSEEQAGKDVGWIASSLFIARVFFGLLWGYLLDKMDPKTVLLISGIFQTISTVLFGFSTSFYWTLVTRFMQGVFKV
nr:probable peptide/nitrate transporter At3g43790 [Hydra vulgaris]